MHVVPAMGPLRYRRNFRMTREAVEDLLGVLTATPPFQVREKTPTGVIGSPGLLLHMTLFRLASNATLHVVSELFGVSEGAVFNGVQKVVRAIVDCLGDSLTSFPVTPAERAIVAAAFAAVSNRPPYAPFRSCLGCVDGTKIRIWKPADKRAEDVYSGKERVYATSVLVSWAGGSDWVT